MDTALLLLHGNNLDETLYLGSAILLYMLFLFVYNHLKTTRLKREKARRKAERMAARRTASLAASNSPEDKTAAPE